MSFMEKIENALGEVRQGQERYYEAEKAHAEATQSHRDLNELISQERARRMDELKERQARERDDLSASMTEEYTPQIEASATSLAQARDHVNAQLESWLETVGVHTSEKTLTRSQINLAGLELPNKARHRRR